MIQLLVIFILITYLSNIISHFRLLSLKDDSHFMGESSGLDKLIPHERRVMYFKIFISGIMFPVISKVDGSMEYRIKVLTNVFVGIFYSLLLLMVLLHQEI